MVQNTLDTKSVGDGAPVPKTCFGHHSICGQNSKICINSIIGHLCMHDVGSNQGAEFQLSGSSSSPARAVYGFPENFLEIQKMVLRTSYRFFGSCFFTTSSELLSRTP